MGRNLTGNPGTSIKIITNKIKEEQKKHSKPKIGNPKKIKKSFQSGKLSTSDMKSISIGLNYLKKIVIDGFDEKERELLTGTQDVSKLKKEVFNYRYVMQDFMRRIEKGVKEEAELRKEMESLYDYSQILQATRDGVIVKQEKRIEKINGEKKEIIYDTSMTTNEVRHILDDYEYMGRMLEADKIDNYIGLGLGLAGTLGSIIKKSNSSQHLLSTNDLLITMRALVLDGRGWIQLFAGQKYKEQRREIESKASRLSYDLLENEQISVKAEEDAIDGINLIKKQGRKIGMKIENNRDNSEMLVDLIGAIIAGIYINANSQINKDGKIEGKSLASALIQLKGTRSAIGEIIHSARGIVNSRKDEEEFKAICEKVRDIMNQMEKKVYSLEGATHSFDSMTITNFQGKFYPKKDYETGKITYSTMINIPEFSIKRGDVVLLSGESGSGKSTFLRFLKRGDINNRHAIKVDDKEQVDNLGKEYISFRPSINLGNESNVLYQITGKDSISSLNNEEKMKLIKILREMRLDVSNTSQYEAKGKDLLEQLASKKFMEFSTGQQKRLALAKVFYRIDDGSSVIIVDEPVGNVEDNLIREQLEMIKKYAQKKNVMLILTTHRIDLAEDLVTKRYHITDGTLKQIPVRHKSVDIER